MIKKIEKLKTLYAYLTERIKGQDRGLIPIVEAVQRAELGYVSKGEPKASIILFGPTGVGKTETCLCLTEFLYGDRNAMIRFDMSEFMNMESAQIFVDRMQVFTETRQEQGGVILFDEMEKAHARILDFFLQILSAARLTYANHKTANLENFYIFFTSNLGSEIIADIKSDKFPFSAMEKAVLRRAENELRPEFFGRIKLKIVYNKLPPAIQREIAKLYINKEIQTWELDGFSNETLEHMIRKGVHVRYGARPLKGTIETYIRNALKEKKLAGIDTKGGYVVKKDDLLAVENKNFSQSNTIKE